MILAQEERRDPIDSIHSCQWGDGCERCNKWRRGELCLLKCPASTVVFEPGGGGRVGRI